jgi:hypothetical protein
MASLWTPRPWLFSILFFVIEIDTLMQARRTGKTGELFWLPLVFALWANLHIQFVVGLLALAAAVGECVLARFWDGVQTRISLTHLSIISIACLLATLVNPYSWHLYQVVSEYSSQTAVLSLISECMALPFRGFQDYGILLFALGAAGMAARARRFEAFELAMLAFAVLVSFRSQRDAWVVVVVASAMLAQGIKGSAGDRFQVRAALAPVIAALTFLVVLLGFKVFQINNKVLQTALEKKLPVRAVEFAREKGLTGPLFNDFSWGGYLIWGLEIPVSIDGRSNIYGNERLERSAATWNGAENWASDPQLTSANLVIGPVNAPLTQLLRMSPRFSLAYEDKVAAVFVARKVTAAGAGPGN